MDAPGPSGTLHARPFQKAPLFVIGQPCDLKGPRTIALRLPKTQGFGSEKATGINETVGSRSPPSSVRPALCSTGCGLRGMAAGPRAWGHRGLLNSAHSLYAGSPPRAWGQRLARSRHRSFGTVHPTSVGTTACVLPRRQRTPVHPHARGDDRTMSPGFTPRSGSPPSAWGRLLRQGIFVRRQRFTPTRVGTTLRDPPTSIMFSVHPHARGDDGILLLRPNAGNGSPPRAWGRTQATVHPPARGDDGVLRASAPSLIGSPPRAWGRLAPGVRGGVCCRFTPTRVGTTPGGTAHRFAGIGSPPRAWGRHPDQSETIDIKRFTPTRVGTTRTWTMRTVKSSVPPHARGDDCVPS